MATLVSANDRRILSAVNTGASSLSFVGSSFIVLCYVLFKELRKFSFKLVFYLALSFDVDARIGSTIRPLFEFPLREVFEIYDVARRSYAQPVYFNYYYKENQSCLCPEDDMLCSFFNILGDPSKGLFCYAQSYSTHFFCVASFLWTTTIAFTLHRTVVRHKTDVEDLEAMFHLYVWGTSLVVTVIRSFGNDHRHFGTWCSSQMGRTGKAVHFITFYMPLWGAILYNGFTYFQVIRMLNNATRMAVGISDRNYVSDTRDNMKAVSRWGYYPLILIGSFAFGTINRVHDFIEPDHKIFWLSFLDVATAALMGLFNSIAYGLNSSVRRAICERLNMFLTERLCRWLPNNLKYINQQQESELVSLKIEDER